MADILKKIITRSLVLLLLTFATIAHAQVPQIINYQGRVAVGTVNFNGSGSFKFALVNAAGNVTYWSNDGTSVAGSQPAAAVALTVTGGVYSVMLGDTSLANMTAIPNSVFGNADVRLRVWFNDGTNGSQQLTPDQRIAAVGYAMTAGGVPNGAITGPMLANGAAAANLSSSGQSAVPSGGIVVSTMEASASLAAAGYVRIGTQQTPEAWVQRPTPPITGRYNHTAVWTGSEMIVWGGVASGLYANDGARFNPATGVWTAVTTTGATSGRESHTAVWTGTEMIVWGGDGDVSIRLNTGGRYNPITNTWTAVTTTGAPIGRRSHTASWTGSEMILWGGIGSGTLNDGARYNPVANNWTALATSGAPSARYGHTAVWTGTEMIVWGGENGFLNKFNTGGRYNPVGDGWAAVSTTGAPLKRDAHTAVWTGSEMIVWGGRSETFGETPLNDGGHYDPTVNGWTPVPASGAPQLRAEHSAVWTGSEMIVWGGYSTSALGDGARYSPTGNNWTALLTSSPLAGRFRHTAVWTGREMLVFGGWNGSTIFNDCASLINTLFLYQRP